MPVVIRFETMVWPYPKRQGGRRNDGFRATLDQTLKLLEYEVEKLDGTEVRIHHCATHPNLTREGRPRADWNGHPGVLVEINRAKGKLYYPCDTYYDWRANLRAIAVTLEALRLVDRHGAAEGRQYEAWKALPPGLATTGNGPNSVHGDRVGAALTLSVYGGFIKDYILEDPKIAESAYREAVKRNHPDKGGDAAVFQLIQQACVGGAETMRRPLGALVEPAVWTLVIRPGGVGDEEEIRLDRLRMTELVPRLALLASCLNRRWAVRMEVWRGGELRAHFETFGSNPPRDEFTVRAREVPKP